MFPSLLFTSFATQLSLGTSSSPLVCPLLPRFTRYMESRTTLIRMSSCSPEISLQVDCGHFFEFKSTSTWKRTKMCCHIFGRDTEHSKHDIVRLLSLGPNHWSKIEKRVSTCWKHTKVLTSVLLSILVRESKEYLLQEVLLRRLVCLDIKGMVCAVFVVVAMPYSVCFKY